MKFLRSHQEDAIGRRDTNSVSECLDEIFVAAILLTGSCTRAEHSVVKAIGTAIPCPGLMSAVLEEAIRIAVEPEIIDGEERTCEPETPVSWLPPELRRVMRLSQPDRQAFVLRLLLGLPRDQCSQLLQIEGGELDERIVSAVLALASIENQAYDCEGQHEAVNGDRNLRVPEWMNFTNNWECERGIDMGKLTNKVAVVTGGSKGIGAASAKRLAAEGASVVVNYHSDKTSADKTVSEIVAAGGTAMAIGADVSNEKEITELFAQTKATYGKLDILVNNAGVYAFGPLEDVTAEKYHHEHNLNVLGLLLTTKAALPLFPAEGGSIVNIGSRVNTVAPANSVISSASKAAVDAITKVLCKELGPRKIRVNSLNPGVITTEGFVAAGLADSPMQKHYVELTPLGRMGEPDDVALPVVFLASDDSRWISGELILVAGGE